MPNKSNLSPLPKRRGSFLEIGNGKLGNELQDAYEEAAIRAHATNAPVTVTAKITVRAPDNQGIGAVSYELSVSNPKRKSILYETECDHTGVVIASAPMDIGVLQTSLYFEDDEYVPEELIKQ